jgi:hypothetical protein
MSKKSKKKTKPEVEITIEPSARESISSMYASVAKAAAAIQALAISQSKPISEIMEMYVRQSNSPMIQMMQRYQEQLHATANWATQFAELTAPSQLPVIRAATALINMERTFNVLVPKIEKELPATIPQTEKIIDDAEEMRKEIISLRNELETLKREKEQAPKGITVKRVSKRGPQRYSDQEKLKALKKWDELDKSVTAISLEEFLKEEFGTDGDYLRVPKSTFHSWRQKLRDKGLYIDS